MRYTSMVLGRTATSQLQQLILCVDRDFRAGAAEPAQDFVVSPRLHRSVHLRHCQDLGCGSPRESLGPLPQGGPQGLFRVSYVPRLSFFLVLPLFLCLSVSQSLFVQTRALAVCCFEKVLVHYLKNDLKAFSEARRQGTASLA